MRDPGTPPSPSQLLLLVLRVSNTLPVRLHLRQVTTTWVKLHQLCQLRQVQYIYVKRCKINKLSLYADLSSLKLPEFFTYILQSPKGSAREEGIYKTLLQDHGSAPLPRTAGGCRPAQNLFM